MTYNEVRSQFHKNLFFAQRASAQARHAYKEKDMSHFNACMASFRVYSKRARHFSFLMEVMQPRNRTKTIDVALTEDYRLLTAGE